MIYWNKLFGRNKSGRRKMPKCPRCDARLAVYRREHDFWCCGCHAPFTDIEPQKIEKIEGILCQKMKF